MPEVFSLHLEGHYKIHLTVFNLVYVEADLPKSPAACFSCPGREPTMSLTSSELKTSPYPSSEPSSKEPQGFQRHSAQHFPLGHCYRQSRRPDVRNNPKSSMAAHSNICFPHHSTTQVIWRCGNFYSVQSFRDPSSFHPVAPPCLSA